MTRDEVERRRWDFFNSLLTKLSDGRKEATKRTRLASFTAFFNFIRNPYEFDLKNPCDSPMLTKLFRAPDQVQWDFLEKGWSSSQPP